MTIEQMLKAAAEYHQSGRLAEAEALYRRVLAQWPNHPDLLHVLGVLAGQMGRADAAIDLIGRAIAINPRVPDYHNNLGESYRRSGRPDAAIASFRRVAELAPERIEGWLNIAAVLQEAGRLDEAMAAVRQAAQRHPNLAVVHASLGNLLLLQGRREEAIAAYRRALAIDPGHAEANNNLGVIFFDAGRFAEAIPVYQRAVQSRPDYLDAINNLAHALKQAGRAAEAIAAYRRVLELNPGQLDAHMNLADSLLQTGQLDAAVAAYQRLAALRPDLAPAHTGLGSVLRAAGRIEEALAAYRRALAIKPDDADTYNNYGIALVQADRLDDAIAAYRRSLEIKPDELITLNNLGAAFHFADRLDEAIATYRRLLELHPTLAAVHSNLANSLKVQGDIEDALVAYRKALELNPDLAVAWSGVLVGVHYHPDYDAQAILAEHRNWAKRQGEPLAREARPHPNDRAPDRTLRVGFISPDLRDHPVGRSLLPLFLHHDRGHYQYFVYSDVPVTDGITSELQARSDRWCNTVGWNDLQVIEQVRQDRIDILVDLSLHTTNNRIFVFARKPAPVQVTMLGMVSTTGLTAIDYRLTDPYLDPPGTGDLDYSERSVRLPRSYWCYEPPREAPPVGPLPATENGFVTFGCLNQLAKVSRRAWQTWLQILQSLPSARLLLHSPLGGHRDAFLAWFEAGGVARERFEFVQRIPFTSYLELFQRIDLCLDPFPYCGGVSTMDSLWMGVPVITLSGRTAVGRGGVSILSNVGLPELIARTPDEYVAIAVTLANDPARLAALRAGLRAQMRSSALMDAKRYAADVEGAFRAMWQTWCGG